MPQRRNSGTYGYIIVVSAFFIQVIAFGTARSVAIYNVEFITAFNSSAMEVSLIGSINLGLYLGAGPVASALMSHWSHRRVALVGAALSNIGLLCMPFAPSITYIYIFYGIVTGLGYALVYIPSHVLSGLYFHKHKSMSTGIASAGLGFGHVVFPIVINRLINYYGWRGSFFIVTGINLHLFIFAALLRPVPQALVEIQYTEREMQYKASKRLTNDTASSVLDNSASIDETSTSLVNDTSNKATSTLLVTNSSNDNLPKYEHEQITITKSIRSRMRHLTDFYFVVFCINNVCWNAGVVTLVLFLPEFMISVGLTKYNAAVALALLGGGTCFGSILGGFLGNLKYINRYILYICGNIGSGVIAYLFLLPVVQTPAVMFITATVFGCIFGIIIGLLVIVTNDLVGSSTLGDAYGCLMLTNGIGILCGPPLAGVLIDSIGTQTPAIYIACGLLLIGGIIMCIVPIRKHFVKKRKAIPDR